MQISNGFGFLNSKQDFALNLGIEGFYNGFRFGCYILWGWCQVYWVREAPGEENSLGQYLSPAIKLSPKMIVNEPLSALLS
ncbi:MAG: hypothetical protein CM15mP120_27850 [Pseudomonadota bacterium]|nr:MAG: hypothetical protein CM15mP120_27850 [Pseudomonadota bacterium]